MKQNFDVRVNEWVYFQCARFGFCFLFFSFDSLSAHPFDLSASILTVSRFLISTGQLIRLCLSTLDSHSCVFHAFYIQLDTHSLRALSFSLFFALFELTFLTWTVNICLTWSWPFPNRIHLDTLKGIQLNGTIHILSVCRYALTICAVFAIFYPRTIQNNKECELFLAPIHCNHRSRCMCVYLFTSFLSLISVPCVETSYWNIFLCI